MILKEDKQMHQMTIEVATKDIASVFGDAMRGEEIGITDHEIPVLKVVPLEHELGFERTPGGAIGIITYVADDFDETPEDFEEYL